MIAYGSRQAITLSTGKRISEMSDFEDLGLRTREACAGELLTIDFVGGHGIVGFISHSDTSEEPEIVLVPAGTKLILDNIPPELRTRWGVSATAFATADTRVPNMGESLFTDGVLFNGYDGHVSLQNLRPGICAFVREASV